jgi:hypothetical protein
MMNEIGREIQRLHSVLAQMHEDWVEEMHSQVPYDPTRHPPGSDYGMHHVDMDATWEQEQVLYVRQAPIFRRIAELQKAADERDPEPVGEVPGVVEFHVTVDGEAVLMLVRHDFDAGLLSYRQGGHWIPVTPNDELPDLDDRDLIEVIEDATLVWDLKEGSEPTLSDFRKVILHRI